MNVSIKLNPIKNQSSLNLFNHIIRAILVNLSRYFKTLLIILVAGMGNLKQNNKPGIIIYSSAIVFLGIGLFFVEQTLIERYFQISQTARTFIVLMYIAFVLFWNGSRFLGEKENRFFND